MSQEPKSSSTGTILMTFLAGAAVGAVVVALTTPKSGPELCADLKRMVRRTKRKASGLAEDASEAWDEMNKRTALAVTDLQRGVTDAAADLRGIPSSK